MDQIMALSKEHTNYCNILMYENQGKEILQSILQAIQGTINILESHALIQLPSHFQETKEAILRSRYIIENLLFTIDLFDQSQSQKKQYQSEETYYQIINRNINKKFIDEQSLINHIIENNIHPNKVDSKYGISRLTNNNLFEVKKIQETLYTLTNPNEQILSNEYKTEFWKTVFLAVDNTAFSIWIYGGKKLRNIIPKDKLKIYNDQYKIDFNPQPSDKRLENLVKTMIKDYGTYRGENDIEYIKVSTDYSPSNGIGVRFISEQYKDLYILLRDNSIAFIYKPISFGHKVTLRRIEKLTDDYFEKTNRKVMQKFLLKNNNTL